MNVKEIKEQAIGKAFSDIRMSGWPIGNDRMELALTSLYDRAFEAGKSAIYLEVAEENAKALEVFSVKKFNNLSQGRHKEMRKCVVSFETGAYVPRTAIYLYSREERCSSGRILVWHYYEVEVELAKEEIMKEP